MKLDPEDGPFTVVTTERKKWVIFTGAGVSEESGIPTFRSSDENSIWVKYDPNIVCDIRFWVKHKDLMLEFGNEIRREISKCEPNKCHYDIAKLEAVHDVTVVTTNVDNLHERAGSSKVLHLHGDLSEIMDINNKGYYKSDQDIKIGDLHPQTGEQLRHNIVMFGEMPNNLDEAAKVLDEADYIVVIGTSLSVYPAAGLITQHGKECKNRYYFDPEAHYIKGFKWDKKKATRVFEDTTTLVEGRGLVETVSLDTYQAKNNYTDYGNRLILEFMEYKYYPKVDGEQYPGWWHEKTRNNHQLVNLENVMLGRFSKLAEAKPYLGRTIKNINYQFRWELLIEVVHKIERGFGHPFRLNSNIKDNWERIVTFLEDQTIYLYE